MDTNPTAESTPYPAAPSSSSTQTGSLYRTGPTEEPENEQDRPKNRMLGVIVLSTLALLTVIVIGVSQIFRSVFNHEVSTKQLEHQGSELRELRAEEQAKLSRYQWVNQKEGVVRIPVDRARELTLLAYRNRAAKPAAPADGAPPPVGGK
jgi:Na+-transporting methylmalonyl-CoA/oxaloacetate decarboxylase gamma subunit